MLAIGFDLDHTLYDRDENRRNVVEKFMEDFNIEISSDYFLKKFNEKSEIEYYKFIAGKKTRKEYRFDRVADAFSALHIDLSYEQMIEFNNRYDNSQNHLKFRPFVLNFFQKIIENGHELFILTNGSVNDQRKKLENLDLAKYISREHWYISGELNMTKPNKKIFKYIEKQIPSEKFLYIGDDFTNDIEPAQELGWKSIYLHKENQKERIHSNLYKARDFKQIHEFYLETDRFSQ